MKLLAVCGYSGSGKTTLLKKLIPVLKQAGLNVGVIKHSHHDIDIDIPGKDSYELRKSGADQTMIACDKRWALITELNTNQESIDLSQLANQFKNVDLVLIEGFKDDKITKIICHRAETGKPLFIDDMTIAVVSNTPLNLSIPILDINHIEQLKKMIINWFNHC